MDFVDKKLRGNFRGDFTSLTEDYFQVNNVCDWSRFDFSQSSVLKLRECVENVRKFSLRFTRRDHPDLNRETIELMHAIEIEIRRRPLDEQYPELWNPLKSTHEALSQIANMQKAENDSQTQISCWQKHFDVHLEPLFTNIALQHLRQNNPDNGYINVFEDGQISKSWNDPNFKLDELIYDERANIFYTVKATFYLSESQLAKTEENSLKFRRFVKMDEPNHSYNLQSARRRNLFSGTWVLFLLVLPCRKTDCLRFSWISFIRIWKCYCSGKMQKFYVNWSSQNWLHIA